MVYVCKVMAAPTNGVSDYRLFPSSTEVNRDRPAFVRIDVDIPVTAKIPDLQFIDTNVSLRELMAARTAKERGAAYDLMYVGEFEAAVTYPGESRRDSTGAMCAIILLSEGGAYPVPRDEKLPGLETVLEYANAHSAVIVKELRHAFGVATLLF